MKGKMTAVLYNEFGLIGVGALIALGNHFYMKDPFAYGMGGLLILIGVAVLYQKLRR